MVGKISKRSISINNEVVYKIRAKLGLLHSNKGFESQHFSYCQRGPMNLCKVHVSHIFVLDYFSFFLNFPKLLILALSSAG